MAAGGRGDVIRRGFVREAADRLAPRVREHDQPMLRGVLEDRVGERIVGERRDPELDADHAAVFDVAPQIVETVASEARVDVAVAAEPIGVAAQFSGEDRVHLAHLVESGVRLESADVAAQEQVDAEALTRREHLGIEAPLVEVRVGVDAGHAAAPSRRAAAARRRVSSMSASVCAALTYTTR